MTDTSNLLERLSAMLQVQPATREETVIFREASHEELCLAFTYWFSQLQLLFGEPVQISITQGLRDEGVDVLMEFFTSKLKIGLQIKSHGDIEEKQFQSKLMAQITYSKKHELSNLVIIPCADCTDKSQESKVSTLISNLSQLGDYATWITPEKAVVVLSCFRQKNHPLNLVKGTQEIACLAEGLARALSDESYETRVTVTSELKAGVPEDSDVSGRISFKAGASSIEGVNLLRRVVRAGQPVTIPGDMIEKLTFLDDQGNPIIPPGGRVEFLKLVPNIARLPAISFLTKDMKTSEAVELRGIQFARERLEDDTLYLVSIEPVYLEMRLKLDFKENIGDLTWDIDYDAADVKDGLAFWRFVLCAINSRQAEMRHTDNGDLISRMQVESLESIKNEWVKLLQNLSLIQDRCGVRIPLPRSGSSWDLEQSRKILELVTNGKVELGEYRFNMSLTKDMAKKAIDLIHERGGVPDIMMKVDDCKLKILNKTISFGAGRVQVVFAKPLEETTSIEERFRSMKEGAQLAIPFVSSGAPSVLHLDSPGHYN